MKVINKTNLLNRLGLAKLAPAAALLLASGMVSAKEYALQQGSVTGAGFSQVFKVLKDFTAFMTGPLGTAVVVISIVAVFATWAFAPKDGIFGPALRVLTAGVVILNVTTWVTQFEAT